MYKFTFNLGILSPWIPPKILLIMKLIIIILIATIMQASAVTGYGQKVTISKTNVSILDVFVEINKQTGYNFLYTNPVIKDAKPISLNVKDKELDEVLNLCFINQPFTYSIENKSIIVKEKESSFLDRIVATMKGIDASGKVLDAENRPIPGVSVKVKGTKKVVLTDAKGNFYLTGVEDGVVLEFSFVGYITQAHRVEGSKFIQVMLKASEEIMDELVVVGYAKQKRAHLTGAVSQVSAKELTRAPMQNLSNMLTGKLPGLTSIQSSGKPGADGTALYVRGLNSFAGNNGPMILVDGVPRSIDNVNPNDVESVSVLKDAAAAIYGVQGANGVILITTKKGEAGAAKILYNGAGVLTQNTAMPDYLNATDYMYWNNKARELDGLTPMWNAAIQNKVLSNDANSIYGETDWLNKIFRTGVTQQHNVAASGGTEKTKYFASMGVMDQEGTLINTGFKRYNLRTNLDMQVAKNLRLVAGLAGLRSDRKWPGVPIGNQAEFDPIRQAVSTIPIIKSEYNGLPTAWQGSAYNVNGYAALMESGFINQTRWTMDSNFQLEYDFSDLSPVLKNLKVSMFGAYNYSNTIDANYSRYYELYSLNNNLDEGVVGASGFSPDNAFSKSASWGDSYLWRPQVDYSREFGKHYVGAMFLFETKKSYSETMTGSKRGYVTDDPVDLSLGSTFGTTPVTGSHVFSGGQASYVGRLNYGYDNKYLAEAAFRYDGSYIFAPGNQWGFFPSASLGWVVSKENFFANSFSAIDLFKLRASFGRSGNDAVSPFQHNSLFALASNSMVLGGEAVSQFYSISPYLYRNLRWSTTDNYNIGLDIDLWKGKLGIEADVFYKLTKDILESQGGNYPSSLGGYYPSFKNSGKVENKGFEVILKHANRINQDWNYAVKGSFAFARNKVLSRIIVDNRPNYRAAIGESMGARYGYEALGLFQSQSEIDNYPAAPSGFLRLGDLKYRDVNGDGIISSEFDYVKTGYGQIPEINFALNLDLSYKNFYVSALWQGASNVDYELSGVFDSGVTASTLYTSPFGGNGNSPSYLIEQAWTPENTSAKYPRLSTVSNGNNAWQSTWWVVNGEYLRLKNLNIGYDVPANLLRKMPFSRVNVFVSGTNLLTFSHFKYVDPESPSVSNGYYPQQKTYSFGLNVTF
jgi:TonB-linked SusC/RagA family outer membrane protein